MNTSHTHPATDPACPIYTIETIAALFGVKVDTAREYSYRSDFPQPRALGARNLWEREEVLAWFSALPRAFSLCRCIRASKELRGQTGQQEVTHIRPEELRRD